ncbi:MAG: NAD(P)/FAD-dependent oxidoreductase [Gemmatimonadota bacterium]|nr:MAG: NAD(P)/FAD-dependent oxidoreductase [Gemmatimonadota bacterium]
MNDTYDAIVIGAGHNGLITAAYVAKAGLRVLVLERRELVGGTAVTEEVFPGFKFDTGAHRISRLYPPLVTDLKLADHGLELLPLDPTVFAPTLDGGHLSLWRNPENTIDAIRQLSDKDAASWNGFAALVAKATGLLETLYESSPPEALSKKRKDRWAMLRMAGRLRRLGKRDMVEVLRILPMTAVELLDEWFETDVLKGTLGAAGITGIFQGPMAAGTAYLFLHQHVGTKQGILRPALRVRGGTGRLAQALAGAARSLGVTIRTGAWVERIIVEDGRAAGVALVGGEEIVARQVISNADPKRTFLDLVDPVNLGTEFLRRVRNIKFNGVCARVNLALGELPDFSSLPGDGPHLRGLISISPSLRYLERAFDDAKYGELSREPFLEAVIPSLTDPSLAPQGKHVMSILVQYAPYHLKDGVWDESRCDALGDRVVETLAKYAPNIESAILHRQVLTPLDLELVFGLTEGNIYHGEMTLDQLIFMRPVPGWARYNAPIKDLYLCGAGTHPGGGVTGAPGYNAAREILKRVK